jgi:V/A-type H+-transporting ATPase subunit I
MISEMSPVEIAGPIGLFHDIVEAIQEAGVLHIREIPLPEGKDAGLLGRIHLSESQSRERDGWENAAHILDEIAAAVPAHLSRALKSSRAVALQYEQWNTESLGSLTAKARIYHARVRSFVRRGRNLTDDIEAMIGYEKVLTAFAPLVETHELPKDFELVGIIFEKKNRLARDMLRQQLERLTQGNYKFLETQMEGSRVTVLLGFPRRHAEKVRAFIANVGIGEMLFPSHLREKPFEEAFAALETDLSALREERRVVREQAERFFQENTPLLLAFQQLCHDRLSRFDAIPKFARTRHAFIIQGWLMRHELGTLRTALRRISKDTVVVRELPEWKLGAPPVILDNSRPVKAFEPLLSFFPLPKYGTLDPTAYVATFFPPIFGLMLGDVGYGALLLLAAGLMYLPGRSRKLVKSLSLIAASCGFFTTVFGFVFGELFGEAGLAIGLKPLWRERFSITGSGSGEALLGYLVIAIAVGMLHVIFGLVLGVINARRTRDKNMALGNLARIAGLAVLFFFVGRLAKVLPPLFTSLGVVALLIFLALMIYQSLHHPSHGLLLPLEVLSTVGNIFSYARIMAIGMASVVLSLLAGMLGGMIGNIVVAALIVVLVHALNLALGIIDPTIQGLRLHYVEFFSKFYLGGGKPFSPFTKLGGIVT